jgi:hypothetical protein
LKSIAASAKAVFYGRYLPLRHQLAIKAFFPNFFSDRLIVYVCLSIVENMRAEGTATTSVMGLSSDTTLDRYRRVQSGSGTAGSRMYRAAKARGCVTVSERINTLCFNSREVLEREFESLGIPSSHGISEESTEDELLCM